MSVLLNHFRFMLGAKSQHGVHSPFVYELLTKGIYIKKKYAINRNQFTGWERKQLILCMKLIDYLNPEKLHLSDLDQKSGHVINTYFLTNPLNRVSNKNFFAIKDFVVSSSPLKLTDEKIQSQPDTVWLLLNTHKNVNFSEPPPVILDFFHSKVGFYHPDLSPQYFKLLD